MGTVGSYDAKTRLPEMLKRTEKGEKITITRHGVPVATLVPAEKMKRANILAVIREIRQFRDEHSIGKLNIKELIEAGRRF